MIPTDTYFILLILTIINLLSMLIPCIMIIPGPLFVALNTPQYCCHLPPWIKILNFSKGFLTAEKSWFNQESSEGISEEVSYFTPFLIIIYIYIKWQHTEWLDWATTNDTHTSPHKKELSSSPQYTTPSGTKKHMCKNKELCAAYYLLNVRDIKYGEFE